MPPPKLDWPVLFFAMAMAALAGATDVYGLVRLGTIFVSFMSGNTTQLGLALGHRDGAQAALIAGVIALFVVGAAAGAFIATKAGPRHPPVVLGAVTGCLCLPLLHDPLTVPALVLSMGALNAAMTRIGGTGISLTYVTGTLVKFGQGLGNLLAGVRERRDWVLQAPMWSSLLAGAVAAAVLQTRLGPRHYWPLPLAAGALTLAAAALVRRI